MWTAPRTYTVNEVLTASIFNTDHRDNLLSLEHILDTEETDFDHNNSTSDTKLYGFQVPANAMGANGLVRIEIWGDARWASGAGVLTIRVKHAGTTRLTATRNYVNNTVRNAFVADVRLSNQALTNSQLLMAGFSEEGADAGSPVNVQWEPPVTTAQDTTAAFDFDVWVQWDTANANNSVRRLWARMLLAQN